MQITIHIPNIEQARLVLQMLRAVPQTTIEVIEQPEKVMSDARLLFGSITSPINIEEIDKRLQEQKEEWL